MKIRTFRFVSRYRSNVKIIDETINDFIKDKEVINIDIKFIKDEDNDMLEIFTIYYRDKEGKK